jgi:glycosyltransferase involved in cell wall biosynthesis
VSPYFPPQVSGSAILLANLLASYPGSVRAIAGYNEDQQSDQAFTAPCPTQYLPLTRIIPRVYSRLRRRAPMLLYRALQGPLRRIIKKLGTEVVLGTLPHDVYIVAAFLVARQLHLPFYAYMHDLWVENTQPGSAIAQFAEIWEPIVLQKATRVLCMTEAMQKHYERKYDIQTYLLPHTIAEHDVPQSSVGIRPVQMTKPTVLFVGAVSPPMNLDALKTLAAASELLPPEYELLYCTSTELATLNRLGIRSSRLRTMYVSRAEVQRLQSEAHVLVAPLSHKDCSIDEVKTVFSTKLLEYFVSGRPIIVFAPEHSYHAESARNNGWGYVVTEDSPDILANAIIKVVTDEDISSRVVQGAMKEAQIRNAKFHAKNLKDWVIDDIKYVD